MILEIKISVIIPVYNVEKYLKQSVLSAIEQEEVAEIILIEDNSPDDALVICKELEKTYEKVKLLRHPNGENRGAGASRNLGIINARYDYIAFLDADDYYLPNRFKEAVKLFNKNNSIDGVYEAVGTYFQDKKSENKWFSNRTETITTITKEVPPDKLFDVLTKGGGGFFHGNGLTIKKNIFNKTGLFDTHLILSQDVAMWRKIAAIGQLIGGEIINPVAIRRVHNDNRMMRSKEKEKKYAILMWETLIDWGGENNIDKSKMNNLYQAYLYSNIIYSLNTSNSFLKNMIMKFKYLFKLIFKYPVVLVIPSFWFSLSSRFIEMYGIFNNSNNKNGNR